MQFRVGLLGLAILAAFVVGGLADQPEAVWRPPSANSAGSPASVAAGPESFTGGRSDPQGNAAQALAEGPSGVSPPDRSVSNPILSTLQPKETENGPQAAAAGQLIGFNGFDGSGTQTITLVHTGKMQIAVYHIDRSGQIRLVSSRPIDADFSLSLNVTAPLPGQIRLLGSQVK